MSRASARAGLLTGWLGREGQSSRRGVTHKYSCKTQHPSFSFGLSGQRERKVPLSSLPSNPFACGDAAAGKNGWRQVRFLQQGCHRDLFVVCCM